MIHSQLLPTAITSSVLRSAFHIANPRPEIQPPDTPPSHIRHTAHFISATVATSNVEGDQGTSVRDSPEARPSPLPPIPDRARSSVSYRKEARISRATTRPLCFATAVAPRSSHMDDTADTGSAAGNGR